METIGNLKFYALVIVIAVIFYSCGEDTIIKNEPTETYLKVITAEQGNLKFEVWSASGDSLMSGYNRIGFKVFENNQPKSSGYVKFKPKMYHTGGSGLHGTPSEQSYNYDQSLEMFGGYIIMLMPSDTSSHWYGFYNYNDQLNIDSVEFDVGYNQLAKFKIFVDLNTTLKYLITVIEPLHPVRGTNNFKCLLHESTDFISFTQVNTANMYLKPKLDSLNHFSAGNVNPVYIGGGIYSGQVNFDYSGLWKVQDSIYYNNTCITETDPPWIVFSVP